MKDGRIMGYYHSVAASYGLQAGMQEFGYVLFLMNDKATAYLDSSAGWEIGVGPLSAWWGGIVTPVGWSTPAGLSLIGRAEIWERALMLIILIGAIGGMMSSGIIGLFVGAVILAFGYKLFMAWLTQDFEADAGEPALGEREAQG